MEKGKLESREKKTNRSGTSSYGICHGPQCLFFVVIIGCCYANKLVICCTSGMLVKILSGEKISISNPVACMNDLTVPNCDATVSQLHG